MGSIKKVSVDRLLFIVHDTRKLLGVDAAHEVALKIEELLRDKAEINMVFASAPSQNEFLEALLSERVEWGRINAFHLDEYIGLDRNAPQGFGNFIRDRLFSKVSCKSVNYMNGNAPDIDAECERYTKLLQAHPTDIVCLGIGENGHLAFNDPSVADFNDEKWVKEVVLDEKCRLQQVHDGCFASLAQVPKTALSMTIPAIFAGRYIFGMIPGSTKAEAVRHTAIDRIGTQCPATVLRTHENAVLFLDRDSAGALI